MEMILVNKDPLVEKTIGSVFGYWKVVKGNDGYFYNVASTPREFLFAAAYRLLKDYPFMRKHFAKLNIYTVCEDETIINDVLEEFDEL